MPVTNDNPTEYTAGGTPSNRGMLRRINPLIFLTIGSVFLVLIIFAALITFTFLPIFQKTKGDQTKYQVRSNALTLIYNLPDTASILPMNWTYDFNDINDNKLLILQKLLQEQLNHNKITKKTSITIMDAFITHQSSSTTNSSFVSPVTLDNNNNSVIIITQSDDDTQSNSTTQLIISLKLRYALECSTKCQNILKESIFEQTFRSLELPIDTFQTLFINNLKTSTNQFLSSSLSLNIESTTLTPRVVNTPSPILASSLLMAINYEAESPLNTFISTTIQSCSACSGEQNVGKIGFTNELIFQQVISQYGGPTIIIFYYTTDRIRSAEIIVNDVFPSTNVTFPIMSRNQNIASLPVSLNLFQGFNSIRIYNPNDYTPDFDRIVVY